MGFPSCYAEDILPRVLVNTLSMLSFIRVLILTLLGLLGLPHFLEPEDSWPEPDPQFTSASASFIREHLPVMKFGEIGKDFEDGAEENNEGCSKPEMCAVCLYDFQDHEEIRRLTNCRHIFHKGCVDRWMDHDQRTCPLCRTPFIPEDLVEAFNEKIWATSPNIPEFGGDFTPLNTFL